MSRFVIIITGIIFGCSQYAIAYDYDCVIDGIAYNRIPNKEEFEVTNITKSNYAENFYVGNIVIPQSVTYKGKTFLVTRIGDNAFQYANINSISLPNSITTIGKYAFDKCRIICKSFTIPPSITKIEANAFDDCKFDTLHIIDISSWCKIDIAASNYTAPLCSGSKIICLNGKVLENVIIPNGITTIPPFSFSSKSVKSITIPNSVDSIGKFAFRYSGLINITIPNSVKIIDWGAFDSCKNLESVTMSDALTTISSFLFSCCYSLKNIHLPSNLLKIEHDAFNNCYSLETLYIPETVEFIDNWTFNFCTRLKKIYLPRNLKTMGVNVFANCENVECIIIYAINPPTITSSTFTASQKKFSTLYVPDNSLSLYKNAQEWKGFYDIYGLSTKINNTKKDVPKTTIYNLQGRKEQIGKNGPKIIYSNGKSYKTIK